MFLGEVGNLDEAAFKNSQKLSEATAPGKAQELPRLFGAFAGMVRDPIIIPC